MDNVNDIIDMLKDRLVEATRKTNRIEADIYGDYTPPIIPSQSYLRRRS